MTQILENVVRCKYFEARFHIKNPTKNSYQGGLSKTTQTLDHVFVVYILIWDKRKSQINEYSDILLYCGNDMFKRMSNVDNWAWGNRIVHINLQRFPESTTQFYMIKKNDHIIRLPVIRHW